MPNSLEEMVRKRQYERAAAHAGNIAANYMQGYRDGLEGEPFRFDTIRLRGREHLLGYAFMEGWHDGNQDRTGRGEDGPPGPPGT